jgi:hypothetical protein
VSGIIAVVLEKFHRSLLPISKQMQKEKLNLVLYILGSDQELCFSGANILFLFDCVCLNWGGNGTRDAATVRCSA